MHAVETAVILTYMLLVRTGMGPALRSPITRVLCLGTRDPGRDL